MFVDLRDSQSDSNCTFLYRRYNLLHGTSYQIFVNANDFINEITVWRNRIIVYNTIYL